jgi:hypothetical protein
VVWAPVLRHLPDDVRLLAYNQRSYARSSEAFAGPNQAGMDDMAAYLEDLVGFVEFAVKRYELRAKGANGKSGVTLLVSRPLCACGRPGS